MTLDTGLLIICVFGALVTLCNAFALLCGFNRMIEPTGYDNVTTLEDVE